MPSSCPTESFDDQQESNESQKTRGKQKMRKQQKGFSLIELLIVVAIILIIAAIAIPNLMRARMAANNSSAAASERSIVTGEIGYSSGYPTIGFPLTLAPLGGASPCVPAVANACLIDNLLATAIPGGAGKSGFFFNATGSAGAGSTTNNQFYTVGYPISNQSGTTSYCAFEDGVIRQQAAGTIAVVASEAACQALLPIAN
ncbi:MAG: prepilin-type N-terminal cleavage/methylation domain-containing protein [Candidatus Sulfotelmatobacter sp.]